MKKPAAIRLTTMKRNAAVIEELAAAQPYNRRKLSEAGDESARAPQTGVTVAPKSRTATASTVSEANQSAKTGAPQRGGREPEATQSLDRSRVEGDGHVLTTNQGVAISDNQHSLKVGLRGPTLLEDFILREKITHFDHERIPERVVHARGSAAHGYFESYADLKALTRAAPFASAGKITPVFARFSTVAGERGSADTVRDIRGFAVKFYTEEGNWDLVGNNIPVFFIQDAIKFPDLIHAVKPEPNNGMPQAGSAHDTFWDFVSLMPESTHTLLWAMSDRAIPRSYRMMQGFGVHTFRLVNGRGESQFVKFHWRPLLGTHSLVWDEAVRIAGADADFHRRDLWEAIESGEYPAWELGLQVFTEEQAEAFSFDVLDATKLIPEEVLPIQPVGRMVLNRNPDNFFAETEQVAFCTAHVVPGIDFSNDPLLAGRIHSYLDTQITRLGGANFHEIPINAPLAPPHNHQRDGIHRQAIHRGAVAYEPNSLAGGCPFQAGTSGFVSFPEPLEGSKLRGAPEKFADHYTQATLFFQSQTAVEQAHIIGGFRFELSKVTVPAIRRRMVASLVNVSADLAAGVAAGLGMAVPTALPRALESPASPEVRMSPALSLMARPGDGSIRTRHVALLVTPGVTGQSIETLQTALVKAGAVPCVISARIGPVRTADEVPLVAEKSFENAPSVLFDAVAMLDADAGVSALVSDADVLDFVTQQYRHGKTILALGSSRKVLEHLAIGAELSDGIPGAGVVLGAVRTPGPSITAFIAAIGMHRHPERERAPVLPRKERVRR